MKGLPVARLSLFTQRPRHRLPRRRRAVAGARAAVHRLLTLDRVAPPVVYDVAPDLFTERPGPRSLKAAFPSGPLTTFGTGAPAHVCGTVCDPGHPNYRQCFSEAYNGRQGVSETC